MDKKKFWNNCIFFGLGVVTVVFLIAVTILIWKWNDPLTSAGLALPTYAPTKTPIPKDIETNNSSELVITPTSPLEGIDLAPTPTPIPPGEPTPVPLCGGPPVMTILITGIDTYDDNYRYGLADVIRIVRVDFVEAKVTVLSLPRDIWVEIPDISDHYGITHGKLNQAYFYGTEGMGYYDGVGQGPGLLSLSLALNFDLYVDHYGSVNMSTMERMIDAVGGIDIYLPTDVDGKSIDGSFDLGYFKAGYNHFNGDEAIRYARIRSIDNDIERMNRQTQVLYALQEKITKPSVLPRIPKLILAFNDSVIADLSPGDLAVLTCMIPEITKDNLVFTTLPQNLLEAGRQYDSHLKTYVFVFHANFEAVKELVGYFQAGIWPVDSP
jgi:LCP family protein required for cell wall assembly